jgi:hypothetical protein
MTEMPLIVARRGDQDVGHMVTTTLAAKAHAEAVQTMLRSYPAPPIAISLRSRRDGRALAVGIAQPARHDICGVRRSSSLKPHHKMGMQRLSVFTHGGISYTAFRY